MVYFIEYWKDIKLGDGKYQISTLGEVRSTKTGKLLKLSGDKDGYLCFSLSISRHIRYTKRIHKLMALTFIRDIEKGEQVCHFDSDVNNNTLANIYIGDLRTNTLDKYRNNSTKLSISDTLFIREKSVTTTQKELAETFGVTQGTISRIVNKKRGVFI